MKERFPSLETIGRAARSRAAIFSISTLGALAGVTELGTQADIASANPTPNQATQTSELPQATESHKNKDGSGAVTLIVSLAAVAVIGIAALGGGNNRRY